MLFIYGIALLHLGVLIRFILAQTLEMEFFKTLINLILNYASSGGFSPFNYFIDVWDLRIYCFINAAPCLCIFIILLFWSALYPFSTFQYLLVNFYLFILKKADYMPLRFCVISDWKPYGLNGQMCLRSKSVNININSKHHG